MAKWLTQEWLDESKRLAVDQPERPGATATLQYVITDGPDGDVEYYWVIEDGHLVQNQLGRLDAPDITLTQNYEDAMAIQKGELDVNAAVLQGRVRPDGDFAKLTLLLPITMSPEFQAFNAAVTAMTQF